MLNKQNFLNAINQNIEMVRNDTLAFNFEIQGLQGDLPTDIIFYCTDNPSNTAIFTLDTTSGITLENYDDETDTLTYSCRIAPEITENLDITRYYYDMTLIYDTDRITLMRGRLDLLYNITD